MMDENEEAPDSPDPEPPGSPPAPGEEENAEEGEEEDERSTSEEENIEQEEAEALEYVQPTASAAVPRFVIHKLPPSKVQTFLWTKFQVLLQEAKELLLEAEGGQLCLDKIKVLSDKGMVMLRKVENLEIAMLDMELMETLFQIFHLNLRLINPDKFNFNRNEFARRILRYCDAQFPEGVTADPCSRLIRNLHMTSHRFLCYQAPAFDIRLGALEYAEAVRKAPKQREKRVKDIIAPVKTPIRVLRVEGRTLESTVLEVRNVLQRAFKNNGNEPVNFLKFVLHPTSFAKSVENIFHLSFLINSNYATVFVDKDKHIPYVKPLFRAKGEELSRENSAAMVISLTMDEWEDAVDALNIQEPMITLQDGPVSRSPPKPALMLADQQTPGSQAGSEPGPSAAKIMRRPLVLPIPPEPQPPARTSTSPVPGTSGTQNTRKRRNR